MPGLSSIWSLVISLISSTIYSEAFWQRVWAAQDPKALRYTSMPYISTLVRA
jgi:hypothetical protein